VAMKAVGRARAISATRLFICLLEPSAFYYPAESYVGLYRRPALHWVTKVIESHAIRAQFRPQTANQRLATTIHCALSHDS
jgi:hypothetical protein